ncbi:unnamed protein product [Strongylus vulgaris]|uniref:Uncharacterized protein n=1 Tax=Strongylus vulgaris TaxID=40348 RepID=A0A3P7J4E6_STRVU|nr:unnamed protein product [Strongylus vulgaris]
MQKFPGLFISLKKQVEASTSTNVTVLVVVSGNAQAYRESSPCPEDEITCEFSTPAPSAGVSTPTPSTAGVSTPTPSTGMLHIYNISSGATFKHNQVILGSPETTTSTMHPSTDCDGPSPRKLRELALKEHNDYRPEVHEDLYIPAVLDVCEACVEPGDKCDDGLCVPLEPEF